MTTLRVTLKAGTAFYLNPFFVSWPNRVGAFRDAVASTGWVSTGTPVTTTTGFLAVVYLVGAPQVNNAQLDQLRRTFDGLTLGVDVIGVEQVASVRSADDDRRTLSGGTIAGGVTGTLEKVGKGLSGTITAAAVVVGLLYLVRNDK